MAVFSPIFVVDTKITFVYNFVAPLKQVKRDIGPKDRGLII